MASRRVSIGSASAFTAAGTPFVMSVTATRSIDLRYVTKTVTVSSNASGSTISFGDSTTSSSTPGDPTPFTLLAGEEYIFGVKAKTLVVTPGSGATVTVIAELTGVDAPQLRVHDQDDLATVT